MSDVIQLLPDSVANQIAAGEVIQRPASVIKELVENSIDAGATRITINLRDAGKTLIQVIDNGSGMSDTDARLAFERHATSKIRQASDLFELHTMGFRGEALPSIAAVAQIDLRTMLRDRQLGTHLELAASRFVSQEPEACMPGTNLSVKNLFFNFPARRKFLKKDAIELGHITREFERLALVNPEVEFELIHNDVTLYQLLPGSLRERIAGLFGKNVDKQLIPVETRTPLVSINGFVSLPEFARKRNPQQFFFVNGRNMRHPYFHKAVINCYDELISPEHQPNYFLNFEVDPQTIDVNIHPTKSEIKFENEQPIWQILSAALREALGKFNAVPALDFNREDAPSIPVFNPEGATPIDMGIDTDYNPFNLGKSAKSPAQKTQVEASDMNKDTWPSASRQSSPLDNWEKLYADFRNATNPMLGSEQPSAESFLSVESPLPDHLEPSALNSLPEMPEFTPGGDLLQLSNRYLATVSRDGLLIIDRHRAHLKTLYNRFLSLSASSVGESQQVMFGEVIDITARQKEILDSISDEVLAMGYELNITREDSTGVFRCELTGVPAVLGGSSASDALLKLISDTAEGIDNPDSSLHARVALSLAQSAAIRANQVMLPAEADQLLADLFSLPDPAYTPDGNPIILSIPLSEISRRL